jgi:hypothetical protein
LMATKTLLVAILCDPFKKKRGFWWELIGNLNGTCCKQMENKKIILPCWEWNLMQFCNTPNNLGSMLLCTTIDDKLLHAFGIVQKNCNIQKTNKDFSKLSKWNVFLFLHYTSKNENKGHECCPKKNPIASFQWKKN